MSRFHETSNPTEFRKEIDLRVELKRLLYGSTQEIPKAYTILVRRMMLDDEKRMIPCGCNVKGEGQKHDKCSVCLGEGFLWTEHFIDTFKIESSSDNSKMQRKTSTDAGYAEGKYTAFYFEYNADLNSFDKLIEFKIDSEGNPIKPYKRGIFWEIHEIEEKRSDNGRVEYIVAYCSQSNHIHSNRKRRVK